MKAAEVRHRALIFLREAVSKMRSNSFVHIHDIPEYPESTKVDLDIPRDLLDKECAFILMKDTLPDGAIRVAIQYSRPRFFGMSSDMVAEGFIISADGALRELSDQDRWDLT